MTSRVVPYNQSFFFASIFLFVKILRSLLFISNYETKIIFNVSVSQSCTEKKEDILQKIFTRLIVFCINSVINSWVDFSHINGKSKAKCFKYFSSPKIILKTSFINDMMSIDKRLDLRANDWSFCQHLSSKCKFVVILIDPSVKFARTEETAVVRAHILAAAIDCDARTRAEISPRPYPVAWLACVWSEVGRPASDRDVSNPASSTSA